MARPYWLFGALLFAAVAQAELVVNVEPANNRVRNNIEAFVGPVEAESRRDMWRLARHSQQRAITAAQAVGYYDVEVRPEVRGPEDNPVLVLHVTLGQPVRFRDIDIRITGAGEGTAPFDLPPSTRLRRGAILNHGVYESAKTLIANQALRYGYFSGRFVRQQLLIDPQERSADVNLIYDTGDRFRLGEVFFSESPFSENLLQRMVPFEAGVAYDSDLLAALNRDLLSTNYFESVQISAPPDRRYPAHPDAQAGLQWIREGIDCVSVVDEHRSPPAFDEFVLILQATSDQMAAANAVTLCVGRRQAAKIVTTHTLIAPRKEAQGGRHAVESVTADTAELGAREKTVIFGQGRKPPRRCTEADKVEVRKQLFLARLNIEPEAVAAARVDSSVGAGAIE